jgi:hypothetical protein
MASVTKVSLLASTALVASNNGTAAVLESLSTDFIGWLSVTVNDGATTVASKIQHSADGSNWVDLAAFTNVVNTTGTQALQITANALPYVRSVVTLSGTPSATVAISLYHDKKR